MGQITPLARADGPSHTVDIPRRHGLSDSLPNLPTTSLIRPAESAPRRVCHRTERPTGVRTGRRRQSVLSLGGIRPSPRRTRTAEPLTSRGPGPGPEPPRRHDSTRAIPSPTPSAKRRSVPRRQARRWRRSGKRSHRGPRAGQDHNLPRRSGAVSEAGSMYAGASPPSSAPQSYASRGPRAHGNLQ